MYFLVFTVAMAVRLIYLNQLASAPFFDQPVGDSRIYVERAIAITEGDLLGDDAWIEMPNPAMGAEDFSYVLHRLPGAMVLLGVRPDDVEHPAPPHSNRMLLNEAGMQHGIALHAGIALQFLEGRA